MLEQNGSQDMLPILAIAVLTANSAETRPTARSATVELTLKEVREVHDSLQTIGLVLRSVRLDAGAIAQFEANVSAKDILQIDVIVYQASVHSK